jgi:arginine:ornithine antiporter/lysine permease
MNDNKLGLWLLTALVVGNMVGSGIFMLPTTLAQVASPAGVLLAWTATGIGVLMLALVFGTLSLRKPQLTGGPQVYAKELFKTGSIPSTLLGYLVSWGYWVANWAGNVAIITTFASYLSTFFPVMTSSMMLVHAGPLQVRLGNLITFLVCSALLWGIHALILQGIRGAGQLNFIATAAKVAGFVFFIVMALFAFQASNMLPMLQPRHTTSGATMGLLGQVNHAAISTLWAFVGVESAVVFSSRARKQSDVKKATMLGLLIALVIYMGITVLVMGTLSEQHLIDAQKPLVDALRAVIGSSGAYIMAGLGLISLTGSTVGWILLSAEVPYQMAKQGLFPKVFLKENGHGAPVVALIMTNVMSQVFIFSTISNSMNKAFNFVIFVATLSYLVPYLIAAIYHLKLVLTGDTYQGQSRSRVVDGVVASLATTYSIYVIRAGTSDMKTFLFGVGLLAAGIVFFPLVHKESRQQFENYSAPTHRI